MKIDKWITFTPAMLRAVMDGRKTVTRRVIVPQPDPDWAFVGSGPIELSNGVWTWPIIADGVNQQDWKCPYGQAGAILGIKEGYQIVSAGPQTVHGCYSLDGEAFALPLTDAEMSRWERRKFPYRRTPGRFMYRSLCRTRLLNKGVRVERVQDISAADIEAEGTPKNIMCYASYRDENDPVLRREQFRLLWDKINKARGFGWDVNPWVWRVEFEVIE
jgi:hypothetical protein